MNEIPSTIRSKGRVTIPAQVRRHLGVSTSDRIVFVLEDDGTVKVVVHRYPAVASLRGAAGALATSVPWSEMRDAAREERLAAKLSRES